MEMIFTKTEKTLPDFLINRVVSWTNNTVEINETGLTIGQILLLRFFMWQMGFEVQ